MGHFVSTSVLIHCSSFCSSFLCADRCEPKGSLSGSNAGITSIEFDSAVSICAISTVCNWV